MFIVFGWGRRTNKDHGPTLPITCPNCHNQTYWRLWHSRTWFTLFFIPVIPYENDHMLLCDICKRGIRLDSAAADRAKVLNQWTTMYLNRQLSDQEYQARLSEARLLQ